ncbi:MAG: hypothetical protein E2O39_14985 [Planctomycetota bacterium]|nr:MAG: hypothetical protein E2O39_14985 [Planctomycetota bacterium]
MNEALELALAKATAVRFLCTGNVVRSAFAELYARHLGCPVPVDSCATVFQNTGLFAETSAALIERGVSSSWVEEFRARHLSLVTGAPDAGLVVFGMTREHLSTWRAKHPDHEHVYRLSELAGERRDIADPVLDGASFERTFEAVSDLIDVLVERLADSLPTGRDPE